MHTYIAMRVNILILALAFLGTLLLPQNAFAQGLGLKVQPSILEKSVEPGEVLEGVLTVTNENGGTQTYYVSSRNVVGMSDAGTPRFSPELSDDPLEAASWLKVDQKEITIEQGGSVQVPYRIEVPEGAMPGSHFAAFFVTREAEQTMETGAGVGFHVASLVNLRVAGDVIEDMIFREFATGKVLFTSPSVYFKMRVDNTGTIHQRPRGVITIKDMFGNDVGHTTFNDSEGAILPYTDRAFDSTWQKDGFAFGKFTAIANILYGETSKKTLTKEVSFWIIPVKELGIGLVAFVVVLLGFVYGVRRYIHSQIKRAGHSVGKKESKQVTLARRMIRTALYLVMILAVLLIGLIVFFA